MKKILIANFCLEIGGGEKLVFELVQFALENNMKPTVFIIDNYRKEYYDSVYKKMHVRVIRTRLDHIFSLKDPFKFLRALYWKIKLIYFASATYNSVQVVNLFTADKIREHIRHKKRFFWHIGNAIQYPDRRYTYSKEVFSNPDDSIVYINRYQQQEIEAQYGQIGARQVGFKLFLN